MPFLVVLASAELRMVSPMAIGLAYFSSVTRTMLPLLNSPSMRTIPGAMMSAPLQTWEIAPMSTTILGSCVRISAASSVGKTDFPVLCNMGFWLIRMISPISVSTVSMCGSIPKVFSRLRCSFWDAWARICFASLVFSVYRRCFCDIGHSRYACLGGMLFSFPLRVT